MPGTYARPRRRTARPRQSSSFGRFQFTSVLDTSFSEPLGELFFTQFSRREGESCICGVSLGNDQSKSIQLEKGPGDSKRNPFIPVLKGMISHEGKGIRRSQSKQVAAPVRQMVSWACQCGLQAPFIQSSRRSPVARDQHFVDGENRRLRNPAGF